MKLTPFVSALIYLTAFNVLADTLPQTQSEAEKILLGAYQGAFLGLTNGEASLRLTSGACSGTHKKNRVMSLKLRTDDAGMVSYLIKFLQPSDIRGTAFLVREKKDGFPDQYVYLPAAKLVRSIAAGNSTATFFGTDFLYADLLPAPKNIAEQAVVNKLADQNLSGQGVSVIEITPKVEASPYGKIQVFVNKTQSSLVQIHYYDRSNKKLKTLTVSDYKEFGHRRIPTKLEMKNEQRNTVTVLNIESPKEDIKFTAADFSESAMKR